MGGPDPPTQWRGVCRAGRFIGARTRLLDGRVKPGHGEGGFQLEQDPNSATETGEYPGVRAFFVKVPPDSMSRP